MLKRKGAKIFAKGAEIDKSNTSNSTDSVVAGEFDFGVAGGGDICLGEWHTDDNDRTDFHGCLNAKAQRFPRRAQRLINRKP